MNGQTLTEMVLQTSGFGPQATSILLSHVPVQREELLQNTMRAVLDAAAYKAIADTYTGRLTWREGDIRDAGIIPEFYPYVKTYVAKARVLDAYGVEKEMPMRLNVHSPVNPGDKIGSVLHVGDLPGSGSLTGFSVDIFARDLFGMKDE